MANLSGIKEHAYDAFVRASEGIVLTRMVDNAPYKTGNLRRMHVAQPIKSQMLVRFIANTPYAAAVHEGSKPHVIKARKKGGALWWPGMAHPLKGVKHPGNRPNPWMTKTIEQEIGNVGEYVMDAITDFLGRNLDL